MRAPHLVYTLNRHIAKQIVIDIDKFGFGSITSRPINRMSLCTRFRLT